MADIEKVVSNAAGTSVGTSVSNGAQGSGTGSSSAKASNSIVSSAIPTKSSSSGTTTKVSLGSISAAQGTGTKSNPTKLTSSRAYSGETISTAASSSSSSEDTGTKTTIPQLFKSTTTTTTDKTTTGNLGSVLSTPITKIKKTELTKTNIGQNVETGKNSVGKTTEGISKSFQSSNSADNGIITAGNGTYDFNKSKEETDTDSELTPITAQHIDFYSPNYEGREHSDDGLVHYSEGNFCDKLNSAMDDISTDLNTVAETYLVDPKYMTPEERLAAEQACVNIYWNANQLKEDWNNKYSVEDGYGANLYFENEDGSQTTKEETTERMNAYFDSIMDAAQSYYNWIYGVSDTMAESYDSVPYQDIDAETLYEDGHNVAYWDSQIHNTISELQKAGIIDKDFDYSDLSTEAIQKSISQVEAGASPIFDLAHTINTLTNPILFIKAIADSLNGKEDQTTSELLTTLAEQLNGRSAAEAQRASYQSANEACIASRNYIFGYATQNEDGTSSIIVDKYIEARAVLEEKLEGLDPDSEAYQTIAAEIDYVDSMVQTGKVQSYEDQFAGLSKDEIADLLDMAVLTEVNPEDKDSGQFNTPDGEAVTRKVSVDPDGNLVYEDVDKYYTYLPKDENGEYIFADEDSKARYTALTLLYYQAVANEKQQIVYQLTYQTDEDGNYVLGDNDWPPLPSDGHKAREKAKEAEDAYLAARDAFFSNSHSELETNPDLSDAIVDYNLEALWHNDTENGFESAEALSTEFIGDALRWGLEKLEEYEESGEELPPWLSKGSAFRQYLDSATGETNNDRYQQYKAAKAEYEQYESLRLLDIANDPEYKEKVQQGSDLFYVSSENNIYSTILTEFQNYLNDDNLTREEVLTKVAGLLENAKVAHTDENGVTTYEDIGIPVSTEGVQALITQLNTKDTFQQMEAFTPTDKWSEKELQTFYYLIADEGLVSAANFAFQTNSAYNVKEKQEAQNELNATYSTLGAISPALITTAGIGAIFKDVAMTPVEVVDAFQRLASWTMDPNSSTYISGDLSAAQKAGMLTSAYGYSWGENNIGPDVKSSYKIGPITVRLYDEDTGSSGQFWYSLLSSAIQSGVTVGTAAGFIGQMGFTGEAAEVMTSAVTDVLFYSNAFNERFDEIAEANGGQLSDADYERCIAEGINEALFEHVSLELLLSPNMSETWRQLVKNIFVASGIEGSEEYFTTWANQICEQVISYTNGEDSEGAQKIAEYYKQITGEDLPADESLRDSDAYDRALRQVCKEESNERLESFTSGALSAFFDIGGHQVQAYRQSCSYGDAWNDIKIGDNSAGHEIAKLAKTLDLDSMDSLSEADKDDIVRLADNILRGKADSATTAILMDLLDRADTKILDEFITSNYSSIKDTKDLRVQQRIAGASVDNTKDLLGTFTNIREVGIFNLGTATETKDENGVTIKTSYQQTNDLENRLVSEFGVDADTAAAAVNAINSLNNNLYYKQLDTLIDLCQNGALSDPRVQSGIVAWLREQNEAYKNSLASYDGYTENIVGVSYMVPDSFPTLEMSPDGFVWNSEEYSKAFQNLITSMAESNSLASAYKESLVNENEKESPTNVPRKITPPVLAQAESSTEQAATENTEEATPVKDNKRLTDEQYDADLKEINEWYTAELSKINEKIQNKDGNLNALYRQRSELVKERFRRGGEARRSFEERQNNPEAGKEKEQPVSEEAPKEQAPQKEQSTLEKLQGGQTTFGNYTVKTSTVTTPDKTEVIYYVVDADNNTLAKGSVGSRDEALQGAAQFIDAKLEEEAKPAEESKESPAEDTDTGEEVKELPQSEADDKKDENRGKAAAEGKSDELTNTIYKRFNSKTKSERVVILDGGVRVKFNISNEDGSITVRVLTSSDDESTKITVDGKTVGLEDVTFNTDEAIGAAARLVEAYQNSLKTQEETPTVQAPSSPNLKEQTPAAQAEPSAPTTWVEAQQQGLPMIAVVSMFEETDEYKTGVKKVASSIDALKGGAAEVEIDGHTLKLDQNGLVVIDGKVTAPNKFAVLEYISGPLAGQLSNGVKAVEETKEQTPAAVPSASEVAANESLSSTAQEIKNGKTNFGKYTVMVANAEKDGSPCFGITIIDSDGNTTAYNGIFDTETEAYEYAAKGVAELQSKDESAKTEATQTEAPETKESATLTRLKNGERKFGDYSVSTSEITKSSGTTVTYYIRDKDGKIVAQESFGSEEEALQKAAQAIDARVVSTSGELAEAPEKAETPVIPEKTQEEAEQSEVPEEVEQPEPLESVEEATQEFAEETTELSEVAQELTDNFDDYLNATDSNIYGNLVTISENDNGYTASVNGGPIISAVSKQDIIEAVANEIETNGVTNVQYSQDADATSVDQVGNEGTTLATNETSGASTEEVEEGKDLSATLKRIQAVDNAIKNAQAASGSNWSVTIPLTKTSNAVITPAEQSGSFNLEVVDKSGVKYAGVRNADVARIASVTYAMSKDNTWFNRNTPKGNKSRSATSASPNSTEQTTASVTEKVTDAQMEAEVRNLMAEAQARLEALKSTRDRIQKEADKLRSVYMANRTEAVGMKLAARDSRVDRLNQQITLEEELIMSYNAFLNSGAISQLTKDVNYCKLQIDTFNHLKEDVLREKAEVQKTGDKKAIAKATNDANKAIEKYDAEIKEISDSISDLKGEINARARNALLNNSAKRSGDVDVEGNAGSVYSRTFGTGRILTRVEGQQLKAYSFAGREIIRLGEGSRVVFDSSNTTKSLDELLESSNIPEATKALIREAKSIGVAGFVLTEGGSLFAPHYVTAKDGNLQIDQYIEASGANEETPAGQVIVINMDRGATRNGRHEIMHQLLKVMGAETKRGYLRSTLEYAFSGIVKSNIPGYGYAGKDLYAAIFTEYAKMYAKAYKTGGAMLTDQVMEEIVCDLYSGFDRMHILTNTGTYDFVVESLRRFIYNSQLIKHAENKYSKNKNTNLEPLNRYGKGGFAFDIRIPETRADRPMSKEQKAQHAVENNTEMADKAEKENKENPNHPVKPDVIEKAREEREELAERMSDNGTSEEQAANTDITNIVYTGTAEAIANAYYSDENDKKGLVISNKRNFVRNTAMTAIRDGKFYVSNFMSSGNRGAMRTDGYFNFAKQYFNAFGYDLVNKRESKTFANSFVYDVVKLNTTENTQLSIDTPAFVNDATVVIDGLSNPGIIAKAEDQANIKLSIAEQAHLSQTANTVGAEELIRYSYIANNNYNSRAYNCEILDKATFSDADVKLLNNRGGLKLYAVGAYTETSALSYMQMITDAAVRGLKVTAFTDSLDFARIFADTGANINLVVDFNSGIMEEARELAKNDNISLAVVAKSDAGTARAFHTSGIDIVVPYMAETNDNTIIAESSDLIAYADSVIANKAQPAFSQWLTGFQEYRNAKALYDRVVSSAEQGVIDKAQLSREEAAYKVAAEKFKAANPDYMKAVQISKRSSNETPAVQPKFNVKAAIQSIENSSVQFSVDNVNTPSINLFSDIDTSSYTPEQMKNYEFNARQTEVGSRLKTLQGSDITRYGKNGVGKLVSGQLYFHKDYVADVIPEETYNHALEILEEKYPDFKFNTIMYEPKKSVIRFDEALDFDTAREPMAGNYISINYENNTAKPGRSESIWHHKWEWVKNDYTGFDVADSWNWSKIWLSVIRPVPVSEHQFQAPYSQRGIANGQGKGTKNWNEQLTYFGLPTDTQSVAQYSVDAGLFDTSGQEHTSAGTSVQQTPRTFTYLKYNSDDRVLDWGAGGYSYSEKALEEFYPGLVYGAVDPFNRTEEHNARILSEFSKDKANKLTINNVLNVIDSTDALEAVIRDSQKYLTDDGVAYYLIYNSGKEGASGGNKYQNARGAEFYLPFIEKYYSNTMVLDDSAKPAKNINRWDNGGSFFIIAKNGEITSEDIQRTTPEQQAAIKARTAEMKAEKNPEYDMRRSLYAVDASPLISDKVVDSVETPRHNIEYYINAEEEYNGKIRSRNDWIRDNANYVQGASSDTRKYLQINSGRLHERSVLNTREIGKAPTTIQNTDSRGSRLSPELAEFLKDTAIKNKDGQPIVMYHATNSYFDAFTDGDVGFHFAPYYQAVNHADLRRRTNGTDWRKAEVIPALLNIKNPAVIPYDINTWYPSAIATHLARNGVITEYEANIIETLSSGEDKYNSYVADRLRRMIETHGYDGILYWNDLDVIGNQINEYAAIAFHDYQIIQLEREELWNLTPMSPNGEGKDSAVNYQSTTSAPRVIDETSEENTKHSPFKPTNFENFSLDTDQNFSGNQIDEYGYEVDTPISTDTKLSPTNVQNYYKNGSTAVVMLDNGDALILPTSTNSDEGDYIKSLEDDSNVITDSTGTYTIPRADWNDNAGRDINQSNAGLRRGQEELSQSDQARSLGTGRVLSESGTQGQQETDESQGVRFSIDVDGEQVTHGIYIDNSETDYRSLIENGDKLGETRYYNRTKSHTDPKLDKYVRNGERIALVQSKVGNAEAYATTVLGEPIWIPADKFHDTEWLSANGIEHAVPEGSKYDVKDGMPGKWYYPFEDLKVLETPEEPISNSAFGAKFSVDSEGNELSDDQIEYFKNSKVRDENGNLLRLYHGTNHKYTTIDFSKSDDGISFFLTDSPEMAGTYYDSEDKTIRSLFDEEESIDLTEWDIEALVDTYNSEANRWFGVVSGEELKENAEDKAGAIAYAIKMMRKANNPDLNKWLDKINIKSRSAVILWADEFPQYLENDSSPIVSVLPFTLMREAYDYTIYNEAIDNNEKVIAMDYKSAQENKFGSTLETETEFRNAEEVGIAVERATEKLYGSYVLYANLTNPFIIDAKGSEWYEIDISTEINPSTFSTVVSDNPYSRLGRYTNTRTIAYYAHKEGYDGVIIRNVLDYGGAKESDPHNVVIAFASNQVKDAKNLHPTESPDFRYSIDMVGTPEFNSAYMNAAQEEDLLTCQDMVTEAAQAAGYTIEGMHGTTKIFYKFNSNFANVEGNWGAGFYFSNTLDDVEANYASSEGPDLMQKIESLAEAYQDDFDTYEEAYAWAKSELDGGKKVLLYTALRMTNPFVTDRHGTSGMRQTVFDVDIPYDEETDEYGEPSGSVVDFINAVDEALSDYDEINSQSQHQDVVSRLSEKLLYDDYGNASFTATDLEKIARDAIDAGYIMDEDGKMVGNEVLRKALELMGFDGIVDGNVSFKFDAMNGIDDDSVHYIVFDNTQIKLTNPITYDENGNIVPIEDRFRTDRTGADEWKNHDIRYSLDFTAEDPFNGRSVYDLTPEELTQAERMYPIGSFESVALGMIGSYNNSGLEDILNDLQQRGEAIPEETMHQFYSFVDSVPISDEERAKIKQDLENLANAYGVLPQGEKTDKEIRQPKYMDGSREIASDKWRQTVLESDYVPEWFEEQVDRKLLKEEAYTHQVVHDKDAMARAKETIRRLGYGKAMEEWQNTFEGGERISKYQAALGQQLLLEALEQGNLNDALRINNDLDIIASVTGQVLQSFRLFKMMTPIGKLHYAERAVQRLNKQYEKTIANSHGKFKKIVINDAIAMKVLQANSREELDTAMEELKQDIGNQIPHTLPDMLNAWRYLAMLGNPATHIRNFLGNAVTLPAVFAKNVLARRLEHVSWLNPVGNINRKSFVNRNPNSEWRKFAAKDYESMKKIISGEASDNKFTNFNELMGYRHVFGTTKLGLGIEKINKLNNKFLNDVEDATFLRISYVRALSEFLQARGVTEAELRDGIVDKDGVHHTWGETRETGKLLREGQLWAMKEAQRNTYHDFSTAANAINNLKHSSKIMYTLTEGILPFTKTPINVLRRGLDYSVVGLVKSTYDIIRDMRAYKNDPTVDVDFNTDIDRLCAGASGLGIMILGALLASIGLLTGKAPDDDNEEEQWELEGHQEYALELDGWSFTLSWTAPFAIPLFSGVELYKQYSEGGDEDFSNVIYSALDPMTSLSMLSGVSDLLDNISYVNSGSAKFGTLITSSLYSYAGQVIPTIFGQLSRAVEPDRKMTYVDKNETGLFSSSAMQRFVQKSLGKLGFLGLDDRENYVDARGNTDTNNNIIGRILENFVSPGYINKIVETGVDSELKRLAEAVDDSSLLSNSAQKYFNVTHDDGTSEKLNLTAEEYVTYQTAYGQMRYSILNEIFNSAEYAAMTDEQKVDVIKQEELYVSDMAKFAVTEDASNTFEKWTEIATEFGADQYIMLRAAGITDTKGLKDNPTSEELFAAALSNPNLTDEQKGMLLGDSFNSSVSVRDPNNEGYLYTLNDADKERNEDIFLELYSDQFQDLAASQKYIDADSEDQQIMAEELYDDVKSQAAAILCEELAAKGRTPELGNSTSISGDINAVDIMREGLSNGEFEDAADAARWFARRYSSGGTIDSTVDGYEIALDDVQTSHINNEVKKAFGEVLDEVMNSSEYKAHSGDAEYQNNMILTAYKNTKSEVERLYASQIEGEGASLTLKEKPTGYTYGEAYYIAKNSGMSMSQQAAWVASKYNASTKIDNPDHVGYQYVLTDAQKNDLDSRITAEIEKNYQATVTDPNFLAASATTQNKYLEKMVSEAAEKINTEYARELAKSGYSVTEQMMSAEANDLTYDAMYQVLSADGVSQQTIVETMVAKYDGKTSINSNTLDAVQKSYSIDYYQEYVEANVGTYITEGMTQAQRSSAIERLKEDAVSYTTSMMKQLFPGLAKKKNTGDTSAISESATRPNVSNSYSSTVTTPSNQMVIPPASSGSSTYETTEPNYYIDSNGNYRYTIPEAYRPQSYAVSTPQSTTTTGSVKGATAVGDAATIKSHIDDTVDQFNSMTNGNLDFGKRPAYTDSQTMAEYGWYGIPEGSSVNIYASTYSQGTGNNVYTFDISPIKEDGSIFTPEELDAYVDTLDTDHGMAGLLKSDKANLIVQVVKGDYDEDYWNDFEEKLQPVKDKHVSLTQAYSLAK